MHRASRFLACSRSRACTAASRALSMPTRALGGDGRTFAKKLRVLDDRTTGPQEITAIRTLWEDKANEALRAVGRAPGVHTGRTASPAPTLGSTHTAIERTAWRRRRPGQAPPPMSADRLVLDDGRCATGRGRRLARHSALQNALRERTRTLDPATGRADPAPVALASIPAVAVARPRRPAPIRITGAPVRLARFEPAPRPVPIGVEALARLPAIARRIETPAPAHPHPVAGSVQRLQILIETLREEWRAFEKNIAATLAPRPPRRRDDGPGFGF